MCSMKEKLFDDKNLPLMNAEIENSKVMEGFGREKDENRADLCLRSIVFSFESSRLTCSILVIKMAVRFLVWRSLPEGEDDSGINGAFLKTNY